MKLSMIICLTNELVKFSGGGKARGEIENIFKTQNGNLMMENLQETKRSDGE